MAAARVAQGITREARNIDVPVLVIAGEHDHVGPLPVLRDNLLPYLTRAKLHVVPNSGLWGAETG
jgi:pimeloyl-ACP methyl ester carboxylesterase